VLRAPSETCQDWDVKRAIKALESNGNKKSVVQVVLSKMEVLRSELEELQRIIGNMDKC
jgi:hypothetical protein